MTRPWRPDFDDVVTSLYEAAAMSHLWPSALEKLSALTHSRGALITRPDRHHDGLLCSASLNDTVAQFFEQNWHLNDLRSERLMRLNPGEFVRDQDITTFDERQASEYYDGFARSAGVPWFAACGLKGDALPMIGISIQRSAMDGAFEGADLERLKRIAPHARAAMTFSRSVADRADLEKLDALELAGLPAFVIDHDARLRVMNAAAEASLGIAVTVRRRRLTALDGAARAAFDRLLASASTVGRTVDAEALAPVRLACLDGGAMLAQAMPLQGAAQTFGDGRAIVTLTPIAVAVAPSAEVLAVAFGLTPAEARIAHQLSLGLEPEEIASACGVSVGAVRFHLKSILPKAGVRRQAAFVAAALSLLR